MKKLLSIALCATAVSAFADPAEAVLGQVGVTEINSGLSNTVVAVSYADLSTGGELAISNLVKTTNLTAGDQLAAFSNGKYEVWTLVQLVKDVGPKFWQKSATKYFVDDKGLLTSETGTEASLVTQAVGTGIWLVRKDPSKPFYIYGKPSTTTTFKTLANTLMLVGNPRQETSVQILAGTVTNPTQFDQIVTVDANGKLCYYTYLDSKVGWCTTDSNGDWEMDKHPTIPAGCGCWIRTQKEATINW